MRYLNEKEDVQKADLFNYLLEDAKKYDCIMFMDYAYPNDILERDKLTKKAGL